MIQINNAKETDIKANVQIQDEGKVVVKFEKKEIADMPVYQDPILKSKKSEVLRLLLKMYLCGMLGFTQACRCSVGLFTVMKGVKDGARETRAVWDCRK